jgi:CheY-like chemotaxis protein
MSRLLNLLLVEDDVEDAWLFQRSCAGSCRVELVTAVQLALARLREGDFDVCFTDYRLGSQSGLELVRQARAEGLRVPIVVITGADLDTLAENALLAGATDFLTKDDLSGAAIARAARWSMIRRHVENRREDDASEDLLLKMLERPPSPVAAGSSGQGLRRLLYMSRAQRTLPPAELLMLCSRFAAANERIGVTGVLVYAEDRFLQVIEGDHAAVGVLLERIARDPLHTDLIIAFDEPANARLFAGWNMGSLQLQDRRSPTPAEWAALPRRLPRLLGEGGSTRAGIEQLIRTLPSLLERSATGTH